MKVAKKKAANKAPLVKTRPEYDTDPKLVHTDSNKVLAATHSAGDFPIELRCPRVSKSHVAVTLFGRTWEVFGGRELIFPCGLNGGVANLHYELVDTKYWGGDEVCVYRKYETNRRYIESRGFTLPGRPSV